MTNVPIQTLPISLIQPNPFQPRGKVQKFELDELAQSIISVGILEPIVVAQTPAGYQIIAGERRWRAAQQAGLTEVPVHIRKTTPKGMLEMALVENIQRVDLSPIERAQAFKQLMRDFKFTAQQISERVGKSSSYVGNTIRLLELPDAIKDGLVSGQIAEGHARAISGIEDEKDMIECYKIILKEHASVRRAEELSRLFREKQLAEKGKADSMRGRPLFVNDELAADWQKKFKNVFNAKSQFKVVRSMRNTKVTIALKGSPEQTQRDLDKIISWAELENQSK